MPYKTKKKKKAFAKEYYKKYKINWHKHDIKKKYGLSLDDYLEMVAKQHGVCAVCLQPEISLYKGVVRRLSVDHDHTTNAMRGLLCSKCNTALGLLDEDTVKMQSLIRYIETYKMVDLPK